MKKEYVFFLTVIALCSLAGCQNGRAVVDSPEVVHIDAVAEAEIRPTEVTEQKETESNEMVSRPSKSFDEKIVEYQGTVPFHYATASDTVIYLSAMDQGEGSFLLKMDIGAENAETLPIQAPQGMQFTHIATDTSGNLYVVVINKENSDNCYIWKIDKDYSVIRQLDISPYMEQSNWFPWAFAVAGNGDLYLRVGGHDGILALVFDSEGRFLSKIMDEDKYSLLDAMGRGYDGKIYAVLMDDMNKQVLVTLDGRNGSIQSPVENILPEGKGMYACIGAGLDSDLLLFGPGVGIITYDVAKKEIKNHIPVSEMFCEADGKKSVFLSDDRLLLIEQGMVIEEEKIMAVVTGTKFYYVLTDKVKG